MNNAPWLYVEPSIQHKVLVPRLIGSTVRAKDTKQASTGNKVTADEFLNKCAGPAREFFNELIELAPSLGASVSWGTVGFSIRLPDAIGKLHTLSYCYPPDDFSYNLDNNLTTDEQLKNELRNILIESGLTQGKNKFKISAPITEGAIPRMLDVFEQAVNLVKQAFHG